MKRFGLCLLVIIITGFSFTALITPKAAADSQAPQITSINPDIASAGTGAAVTVDGINFGVGQESSRIEFWWHEEYIRAEVISWNDTQIICEVPRCSSGDTTHGVRVVTPSGNSNDYPFEVTFAAWPDKWAGPDPMSVRFYVNLMDAPPGALEAILRAAQTWNKVRGADFYFEFGGVVTEPCAMVNGRCEVFWQSYTEPPAYAWAPFVSQNGCIIEADIIFNSGMPWSADGTTDCDVESYAVHEFGHWLGLIDLYGAADIGKIMYGYPYGHRTLAAEDVEAIRWLYPGAGTRGQYYVRVTNNTAFPQHVYFKTEQEAHFTRSYNVPAGGAADSWREVVPAGVHTVNIEWSGADGALYTLSSVPLDVPVEGDTQYSFTLEALSIATPAPSSSESVINSPILVSPQPVENNAMVETVTEVTSNPVQELVSPTLAPVDEIVVEESIDPETITVSQATAVQATAPSLLPPVTVKPVLAVITDIEKYLIAGILFCMVIVLFSVLITGKKAKR